MSGYGALRVGTGSWEFEDWNFCSELEIGLNLTRTVFIGYCCNFHIDWGDLLHFHAVRIGFNFHMNLINLISFFQTNGMPIPIIHKVNNSINCIYHLSVALFAAFVLFSWQNKKLVRNAALFAVLFASLNVLMKIYLEMNFAQETSDMIWSQQFLTFFGRFNILMPIAFITIAGIFLSKQQQQMAIPFVPESTPDKKEEDVFGTSSQDLKRERIPVTAEMNKPPQIKKPTLVWVIIGFSVTFLLFITSLDYIEDIWYLFVLFIVGDIAALAGYFNRKKVYNKMLKEAEGISEDGSSIENFVLNNPATIKVVRESSIVGAIVPYKVYLNNEFVGKIKNGHTLELSTSVSHNIVRVFDNNNNPFQGDFTTDLEAGGYAEVHVKAGRFVKIK